ncbi:NUDIX domain-containing protein [Providencia alcalifaciens]|uniref:NUDIX hydrolase n=1 Tax=Providencia TaxID=586 RepID=UPI001654F926|nr:MULTISPECIES: NUDIX domain-containing protein [Providencia]MBC8653707.1 NUDIX domain-containing protein [Providencia vermicola]ELR5225507.1 NUDIX domain-containing protein [Providencia rettgeri]ELR5278463.1 NUDIX domain-containing protein [Providencia rettgeri]ELU1435945.1 NUDIX domain-containing protein [Providencia rettgeri]ELU1439390.1 NUDIX domain-containing protein [Providencia rettgeri]
MTDKIIDKLGLIALSQSKIAMVRSHNKQLFYIPGGKRELGETDEQALCREIDEELTLKLDTSSIRFYGEFIGLADGKQYGTQVRIRCYFAEYNGKPQPAAEIAELAWFDSHDLSRCSTTAVHILQRLKQDGLIK